MNYFNIALLVFVVLLIPLSRFVRARWVPLVIATVLFLLQASSIILALDVPSRALIRSEIEAGRIMKPAPEVATEIRDVQMPVRLRILILGLGLFVTVCCWGGVSRPSPARSAVGDVSL